MLALAALTLSLQLRQTSFDLLPIRLRYVFAQTSQRWILENDGCIQFDREMLIGLLDKFHAQYRIDTIV